MSKWIPRIIASTYNSIAKLNANFSDIAGLFDRVLFRDGTAPNAMSVNLDMNHNRIVNVADAVDPTDAVNLNQLTHGIAITLPVIHAGTLLANTSSVSAQPVETGVASLQPYFSVFGTGSKGLVPSSPGGTATFLCADGTWRTPATNVGSVSWGSIFGTLSSQTDLVAALATKADLTNPSFIQSMGLSDGSAAAFNLTKTGTSAGTASIFNDGALNIVASAAGSKSASVKADSLKVYTQDGLTQMVTIDNGGDLTINQNQRGIHFTDANGGHPLIQCQVDNNLVCLGTDALGGIRLIWNVGMHSSTSPFVFSIPVQGPTASPGDSSTQFATTAFVQNALSGIGTTTTVAAFTADFTVANSHANTYQRHTSSSAHTVTLNGTPSVGVGLVIANRGSGVVTLSCATGIYKNGASGTATSGTIAAGGVVQLFHEGAGVWVASGDGLA